jgi:hypothetical protein
MLTVLFGGTRSASAEFTTSLNGTWRLQVKPDAAAVTGGRDAFEEYVLIEDEAITAHEMSRLGFGPILPTLGVDATGAITFTVNLTSKNHGTCTWSGKMTTATMTGTLVWNKNGKTYNYTFTGTPYTPDPNVES